MTGGPGADSCTRRASAAASRSIRLGAHEALGLFASGFSTASFVRELGETRELLTTPSEFF